MASSVHPPARTTDPRAWTAATLDDSRKWYYPLSARCLAALDQVMADLRRNPRPPSAVRLADYPALAACRDDLRPVHDALETGRGFAIVEGGEPGRYSKDELTVLYWLVGQLLGKPFEQNVQGTVLYDVRDTGQDLSQGARFSVTSYESSFHTDNSFGDTILDYVGLLCLNTARSGGVSQVISGYAVCAELRARHPEVLETLARPFHVDRRGGLKEGQSATAHFPVVQWDGDELLIRYLRYWIQVGHDKAGQPLTPAQVKALDTLDEVMRRRDLIAEFNLKPGDLYFINNRWILHNRTAFEDHPEPERRRHLVRLWLRA
jgi:alpha-ketoglutarate-dependent taurine dioxygenase